MATYSQPGLTISSTPNKYSPVNGYNYWVFTGDFNTASTTADINLSKVFVDLEVLNQSYGTPIDGSLKETLGRFRVPARTGNIFLFDPQKLLDTKVSFTYDNPLITTDGFAGWSGTAGVINESSGFGPTSFGYGYVPLVAPDKDSIVRYRLHYGLEWDPNIDFVRIQAATISGITYSQYVITSYTSSNTNQFVQVGDLVKIFTTSGLFSYFNGTASVKAFTYSATGTFVTTDQVWTSAFGTMSIPGTFDIVQHYYGYSNDRWAYNGARQYEEKNIDFGKLYTYGYTSSSVKLRFMNDWGTTASQAIPIKAGQGERVRFMKDENTYQPDLTLYTYDNGVLVYSGTIPGLSSTGIQWSPGGGGGFKQKCFTLQVFDQNNTIPIVHNRVYRFSLSGGGYEQSIYYIGDTACSKYENVRIKFLNRQGTWCYVNFNKDNKHTSNISKTEYKQPLKYDYSLDWRQSGYSISKQRGSAVLSSSVNETYTLNSDWISEEYGNYLVQLLTSPEVYVFYDTYTQIDGTILTSVNIPVIITDSNYVFKTVNRDKLFNLTINYKLAYDTTLQNQ
jgi:hypothetical protein